MAECNLTGLEMCEVDIFQIVINKFRSTLAYDILARVPLVLWFAICAGVIISRLIVEFTSAPVFGFAEALKALAGISAFSFILLMAGALCLRIRPIARAAGLFPRLAAVAGTFSITALGILPRAEISTAAAGASFLLICAGYALACYALRHLGRSLSMMAEARRLVITGPYALTRHPLYTGEALASLGLLVQYLSPMAVVLWVAHISLQLCRMHYEEGLLRHAFPEYRGYAGRVSRLIPGIY
jgi:protein-S-isoprenylcysteine O-methyltransferase Ste14